MTAQVLANPARYGIVPLTASDPVPIPVELRRADGKSWLQPHHDERYTTVEQLNLETGIVAAARTTNAQPVTGRRWTGREQMPSAQATRHRVRRYSVQRRHGEPRMPPRGTIF